MDDFFQFLPTDHPQYLLFTFLVDKYCTLPLRLEQQIDIGQRSLCVDPSDGQP